MYLNFPAVNTWQVSFVIPTIGAGGRAPRAEDADKRKILEGSVSMEMLAGIGPGAKVRQCAKRAGMPIEGIQVPFATRIRENRIPKAPAFRLRERTPYGFTVAWREPGGTDGFGREAPVEITHYQIEIATTATSGTYFPWQSLWCGPGHESPDARLVIAHRTGATANVEKLTKLLEDERAALDEFGKPVKVKEKLGKKPSAPKSAPASEPLFTYSMPVDPTLFGKLRIRCWAKHEERPSKSTVITLPRWNGTPGIDIKLQMVVDARAAHFRQLTAHVSVGLDPVAHRIGNPAGHNKWGGDAPPLPPPPTAKEKAMGNVMAPVPYDVPRLPLDTEGVEAASETLASFYRQCGVLGGGGGTLFGLRIDHVLHAIVGTPTLDGGSSPSRTVAGMGEPLMALCEVAYSDVLLELFHETAVLKPQWLFVDEKVYGAVGRVAFHRAHYDVCEPRVKEILYVMIEIWESARQCQPEEALTFHLQHDNYTRAVKKKLAHELTAKLKQLSWRLSTELLQMQLAVRTATRARPDVIESRQAGAEADMLQKLLMPSGGAKGGGGLSRLKSLKRAVTTRGALTGAFARAQEKSLAQAIEEMSQAADARAAAEFEARLLRERVQEDSAARTLQSEQRGRIARKRTFRLKEDRGAAEEAAIREEARSKARAAALEAQWDLRRDHAARTMQGRQRGILARQRTVEMREERDVRDVLEARARVRRQRMAKLRFALRAHAGAIKVAQQMTQAAARRREELAKNASYKVTDSRLDLLERTDNEMRKAAWSSLKESVVLSEMIPVACGLKFRARTLYLDPEMGQQTPGGRAREPAHRSHPKHDPLAGGAPMLFPWSSSPTSPPKAAGPLSARYALAPPRYVPAPPLYAPSRPQSARRCVQTPRSSARAGQRPVSARPARQHPLPSLYDGGSPWSRPDLPQARPTSAMPSLSPFARHDVAQSRPSSARY